MPKLNGWKLCWVVYNDRDSSRKSGYKTGFVRDEQGNIKVFTDHEAAQDEKASGRQGDFRLVSSVFHFCEFGDILRRRQLPDDSPFVVVSSEEGEDGE